MIARNDVPPAEPEPEPEDDGARYLHSRCHINVPTWARIMPDGFIEIICAKCRRKIIRLELA
jgi:hypothetical protein